MTPLTIAIAAFVLALIFGFVAVWGAPIFAVPIVLAVIAVIGARHIRRRAENANSMREFRRQAGSEKVEFTDRDRRTTV